MVYSVIKKSIECSIALKKFLINKLYKESLIKGQHRGHFIYSWRPWQMGTNAYSNKSPNYLLIEI